MSSEGLAFVNAAGGPKEHYVGMLKDLRDAGKGTRAQQAEGVDVGTTAFSKPPVSAHPPLTTCPYCGGTVFTEIRDVAITAGQDLGMGRRQNAPLRVSVVACDGCGHLDLFAKGLDKLARDYPSGPQGT